PFCDRVLHVLEPCWVCGFRLLPSAAWFANARARRIIGQVLALSDAFLDGVRIASQDVRTVGGPTMAPGERFDGRIAAAVLFREALGVLPQQLFDVRSVVLRKVKRHDGSSRSPVLPAMGGADQEVFMNRNRNARAHELGIYFGAMPNTTANLPRQKPTAGCPPWRRDRRHLGISAQHTVERFAVVLGHIMFEGVAKVLIRSHKTRPNS